MNTKNAHEKNELKNHKQNTKFGAFVRTIIDIRNARTIFMYILILFGNKVTIRKTTQLKRCEFYLAKYIRSNSDQSVVGIGCELFLFVFIWFLIGALTNKHKKNNR